jgi:hypothetical protein
MAVSAVVALEPTSEMMSIATWTQSTGILTDLFAVDADARAQALDHAARHALHLQKAPSLLDAPLNRHWKT